MKTNRFSLITVKYSSVLIGGGRCKPGELVVMFPRNIFIGEDETGSKKFMNSYVRLNDLHKFPQLKELREAVAKRYGINPDTYTNRRSCLRK